MKRGCFVSLLILGACFGGYWYLLHGHVEPPALWWATGIASFFMWISIGALRNAIAAGRDAARVASDSAVGGYTGEQYADDATVTVVGHIRATGPALTAPLSGKPAVLYSYEISHVSTGRDEANTVMDFSGFALTPCAIDSPHGSISLFGFPLLEGFDKASLDTDEGRRNGTAYLASAPFMDMEGFHPGAIYSEVKSVLTDDDGQLRKDWKMTEDRDLSDKSLSEQIVAPGEQVCAIGRYSAAKRGLVPHGANVIRLIRGDPQQLVGTLRGKAVANLIGCLVVATIINGGISTLLQIASGRSSLFRDTPVAKHSFHGDEMQEAVRAGNIAAAEKLAANGTGVDVRDSDGRTPLAMTQDASMARWLIAHGANVNAANSEGQTVLMNQASAGRADIVGALVKAGAKLDKVNMKWHTTALTQALDGEHDDVARILRDAGAKDDTVTEAKGHAVREDDPPVRACMAWLDAIQHEDVYAMKEVSTFTDFNDADTKSWKSSHPAYPKLVGGYATENAATVQLRGAIASGIYETWTYQLVHRGGDWRVTNERWQTKLSSNAP